MKVIREEISRELYDNITPFWMKLIDKENGGFFGEVDFDLNIHKEADKGAIHITRILWFFSAMYNRTNEKVYLEYATHAYDFIVKYLNDSEYNGLYWMLDYKGNPIDARKHVYAQAFGVYSLCEYYKSTNDEEVLSFALELYNLIETKGFDNEANAYMEEFNRYWFEIPNEMLSENGVMADITTNTHLHVLEAYTNLYKVWKDKGLRERLINLLDIFYEKIFDNKSKFLKVFFDKNWNPIIDLQSYGHDIEASWLLDEAVKVLELDNNKYIDMILDIAYNIADRGILNDGSLLNECEDGKYDCTRVWWVQAEAIVGFLNAYEHTKNEKFINVIIGLWKYIKENIIDKRDNSEWYWSVEEDGSPTVREINGTWKCPYHNGRFCLELIERLEAI